MISMIIGASAGLGRALAEELAGRGHDLYLVASGERDLETLANDLRLSHGVTVRIQAADLADMAPLEIHNGFKSHFGGLDNLFLISGFSYPQDRGQIDPAIADRLISVNFTAAVQIVNAFLSDMEDTPGAHIVGIGSVAASRGRSRNAIYGASKRGLEFYFEAIRHYLAGKPCKVHFYRAGYMATQMLGEQRTLLPKATPGDAAKKIADRLGKTSGMFYLPSWWRWVVLVFTLLPWPIFRRLDV